MNNSTLVVENQAVASGSSLLDNLLNQAVVVNPADNISVPALVDMLNCSKRVDYAAAMNQMHITETMPDDSRDQDRFAVRLGDKFAFGMSGFAVKQLNQKLSRGFGTYAAELADREMNDLYLDNVNELLRADDRKSMIRVLSNGTNYARAFVSDKYLPIDDLLVFGSALEIIQQHLHKFKPIGGNRTDTKTYCKFVSKEPMFEINVGGKTRAFSAGFIISNSEVGQGNAQFQAFFTDSYCDNGIIFSREVIAECKFKHIGSRITTDFGQIMGERVNKAKQEEISNLITSATELAVCSDQSMLDPIKDQIIASSERKLEGEEIDSIRNVLKSVGIAKGDTDYVIRELDPADNSQFGVQAAITAFAQKADTYEKRIDLEQKGGDVINLNSKAWGSLQAV